MKITKISKKDCERCKLASEFDEEVFLSLFPKSKIEVLFWDLEALENSSFFEEMSEVYSSKTVILPVYVIERKNNKTEFLEIDNLNVGKWELQKNLREIDERVS